MKKIVRKIAVALMVSAVGTSGAMAATAVEALGACLADNTTGKDRKDMARWVFVGMATHPEIKSLSSATDADRVEMDKRLAALFSRLITENCPAQAKKAMEEGGTQGFGVAFSLIGQLAMQELMSDKSVAASFANFAQYLDKSKIEAVLK